MKSFLCGVKFPPNTFDCGKKIFTAVGSFQPGGKCFTVSWFSLTLINFCVCPICFCAFAKENLYPCFFLKMFTVSNGTITGYRSDSTHALTLNLPLPKRALYQLSMLLSRTFKHVQWWRHWSGLAKSGVLSSYWIGLYTITQNITPAIYICWKLYD